LFEDAVQGTFWQVFPGLAGDCDTSGPYGVLELPMTARHLHQLPSILLQQMDDVTDFHLV
jgi:hypothetical protein